MVRTESFKAVRAILLVAFMSALVPAVAQAQPTVIYDGPYVVTPQPHPCIAGETVSFNGRQTITSYARFDSAGGMQLTLRFITKATGTGVSSPLVPQKDYVLNEESIFEMNLPANSTTEQTSVLNHVLIRKAETDGDADLLLGTGDDFLMKETAHTTTHGGVPVVSFTRDGARCM